MENTIYIALSRQMELRRQMGVISHNLANMNTPAYKSEKMVFVEYLSKAKTGFDRLENGSGDGRYAFVRAGGQARNLSEGPMNNTGNVDVGISGRLLVVEQNGKTLLATVVSNWIRIASSPILKRCCSKYWGSITIPVEQQNFYCN